MPRRTTLLRGLMLATWLVPVVAQAAEDAQTRLQGRWTATKAIRDGKAADDLLGHRLSFTGNRFEIRSVNGERLYSGVVRTDPSVAPATIDFEFVEGSLKGQTWKGIYALDGDRLTTCDNAPNMARGRPASFEAGKGSGYVLITFERAKH